MSEFYPKQRIPFDQVEMMNGSIRVLHKDSRPGEVACLTDGTSCLWAHRIGENGTILVERGDQPTMQTIITALETQFNTVIPTDYAKELEEDADADRTVEGESDGATEAPEHSTDLPRLQPADEERSVERGASSTH